MIKIIPPTVYVPKEEELTTIGFEGRCISEGKGWYELWIPEPRLFVRYYVESKAWEMLGIKFYPTCEEDLKTILRCTVVPSISIK